MKRGPAHTAAPDRSFADKAFAAWGNLMPDWVAELARVADAEGLSGCEKRIGYSKAAISNVLNGKYPGDLDRVAGMVRGALMAETVECPVIGTMSRDRCLKEQAEPFRATSAFRAQLFHACRSGCPNARKPAGDAS